MNFPWNYSICVSLLTNGYFIRKMVSREKFAKGNIKYHPTSMSRVDLRVSAAAVKWWYSRIISSQIRWMWEWNSWWINNSDFREKFTMSKMNTLFCVFKFNFDSRNQRNSDLWKNGCKIISVIHTQLKTGGNIDIARNGLEFCGKIMKTNIFSTPPLCTFVSIFMNNQKWRI